MNRLFTNDPLWQRLAGFRLDESTASLTFTRRLARENDWSIAFAAKVVEEYRRFLYLTQVADHQVTPSDEVDQAWHLHLTYTESYWQGLCKNVLKRPLHHGPTKGGEAEGVRFEDQYERTLASYREAFGEAAPADVWPPSEIRFGEAASYVRVNRTHAWVIPKPWKINQGRPLTLAACFLLVTPTIAVGALNPFDFDGPSFLNFYAILAVMAVLGAIVCRLTLRAPDDPSVETNSLSNPELIAALRGGWQAAFQTALAKLVQSGAIKIEKQRRGLLKTDYCAVATRTPEMTDTELEQTLLLTTAEPGKPINELGKSAKLHSSKIVEEIERGSLLETPESFRSPFLAASSLLGSVWLVGAIKVVVGISRDKPVGFLIAGLVVLAIVSIAILSRPRRTKTGERILKRLVKNHHDLKKKAAKKNPDLDPSDIALAVGLYGIANCGMSELSALRTAIQSTPANDGGWSSGCGDGGGGGCGGGGCGGCGGCGG